MMADPADFPPVDKTALHNPEVRYERRGISVGALILFGILTIISAAFTFVSVYGLFMLYWRNDLEREAAPLPVAAHVEPPAPELETYSGQTLESVRAAENAHTEHYGWVDREAGVVRIPIERAMELYLQRRQPAAPADRADRADRAAPAAAQSSHKQVAEQEAQHVRQP